MIGKLKGIIDAVENDHLIIEVGGVGYAAFVHTRLLHSVQPGDAIVLVIETHVREDHIHLYGFTDTVEREWFRTLIGIERVGNRMALAILGAMPPQSIVHAVISKDATAFTRISGVGAKLAERILVELKDKVLKLPVDAGMPAHSGAPAKRSNGKTTTPAEANHTQDAISALVNLGYGRSDAARAAMTAAAEAEDSSLDLLIKRSLKELQ